MNKLINKGIQKFNSFFNASQILALFFLLFVFVSYNSIKIIVGDGLQLSGTQTVTGIKTTGAENSDNNLITQAGVNKLMAAVNAAAGNVWQAVTVGTGDVIVPAPGGAQVVTGTDSHDAIQAAVDGVKPYQLIIVPANVLTLSPIRFKTNYTNIVFLGNVYTNGGDLFISEFPNGADRQNIVTVYGTAFGKVNLPSHNYQNANNGTGPDWQGLTGSCVSFTNVNKEKYKINKIYGFRYGFNLMGGTGPGSPGGQENSFACTWIDHCYQDIRIYINNGSGYMDKNVFTGWDGGSCRLSGSVGIVLDGNSTPAGPNLEKWNGAIRSNEFHVMIEKVDSIMWAYADATENEFDITFEAGDTTSVFSNTGFNVLSVGPNGMRSPKYTGRGVLCTRWMTKGMGYNGTINQAIYYNCSMYVGNSARLDGAGKINVDVVSNFNQFNRNLLPSNFECVNIQEPDNDTTIISASYTLQNFRHFIKYNNANGVLTFPGANTRPTDQVYVQNINANALTVTNVQGITSIPSGMSILYRSDGTNWNALYYADGVGSGGGGGPGLWTVVSPNMYTGGSIALGGNPPSYYAWLNIAPTTTAKGGIWWNPAGATYQSSPPNGLWEYNSHDWRATTDGVTQKVILEHTQATVTDLSWQALDIAPSYFDPLNSLAGDNLVSNGVDGAIWARPKFTRIYSTVTPSLVIGTGEASMIGSAISFNATQGSLVAGDMIEARGKGILSHSATCQFKFILGGQTIIVTPINTAVVAQKGFSYEFIYTCTTAGTSGSGSITIDVELDGEIRKTYRAANLTSINSSLPTFNALFKFNSGPIDIAATFINNSVDVIRR